MNDKTELPHISHYPPTPHYKVNLHDKLTTLFNAWKDESIENPEKYDADGWKDDDYGEACAEYVIDLAKRLNIEIR